MTDFNKYWWWTKSWLLGKGSDPTSSLCSEVLSTRCSCLIFMFKKKNYPQFVWLRAYGRSCTGVTVNLEGKGQRESFWWMLVIKHRTDEDNIAGNALILQVSGKCPVHYILSSPFLRYSWSQWEILQKFLKSHIWGRSPAPIPVENFHCTGEVTTSSN